ncbi:DUF4350 domain-containing protein [Chryseotalea sanaruensis]|uniref:DUF4350 domain-containing protein n=1 Tax=Chryseotalea sanaruensis TaxID=2482724 RepID=A0A401UAR1_9BACT|nr:DUF4350 domain-containing protein [Chryseotalea sanaruensis]GCC51979.1 DUF4350 domain-containing protein [Chryseotalea sanaruensis]
MQVKALVLKLMVLCSLSANAQQLADTLFKPTIINPAYQRGTGSVVRIDEAHYNFHTMRGRYLPFARVLEQDGYRVERGTQLVSRENLDSTKIFVIANALHASNQQRWTLPTPSAFTDEEIEALTKWVQDGGSLFLIADHMPFPGAAEKLAKAFDVAFINGFAMKNGGRDIFTIDDGLVSNTLTQGRDEEESVTTVQTFTGQGFKIPTNAQAIITLNDKYKVKIPEVAWEFNKNTPSVSGEDLVQGAYMKFGKGRIVVFGEAAMFTAQRQGNSKIGMNEKSASQNMQLLLNIIHWLDGMID